MQYSPHDRYAPNRRKKFRLPGAPQPRLSPLLFDHLDKRHGAHYQEYCVENRQQWNPAT